MVLVGRAGVGGVARVTERRAVDTGDSRGERGRDDVPVGGDEGGVDAVSGVARATLGLRGDVVRAERGDGGARRGSHQARRRTSILEDVSHFTRAL